MHKHHATSWLPIAYKGRSRKRRWSPCSCRLKRLDYRNFLFNRRVPDECVEGRQTVIQILLQCRAWIFEKGVNLPVTLPELGSLPSTMEKRMRHHGEFTFMGPAYPIPLFKEAQTVPAWTRRWGWFKSHHGKNRCRSRGKVRRRCSMPRRSELGRAVRLFSMVRGMARQLILRYPCGFDYYSCQGLKAHPIRVQLTLRYKNQQSLETQKLYNTRMA